MSPRAWSVFRSQLSVFLTIELVVFCVSSAALATVYTPWIFLLTAFFGALLGWSLERARRRAHLLGSGRVTSGVITHLITTGRGAAEVAYRFATDGGIEHVAQQPLSRAALSALAVGQTVDVAYDPADPRRCVADPLPPRP